MKSMNRRKPKSARILYLRTFKDSAFDHTLIIGLALIMADLGKLIVLGSPNDEMVLQARWQQRIKGDLAFTDYIDYIQSSDSQWRPFVHREIASADCILLFMEPKGRKFPRLDRLKIRKGRFEDYFMGPLLEQSTGSGLLQEIIYLDRLKKIRRTIVLCRARSVSHLSHLIEESYRLSPTTGAFVLKRGKRRDQMMLPHLSALDSQVGHLHDAVGIVTFRQRELNYPRSPFAVTVKSLAERVCSKPRASDRTGSGASAILQGRSDRPRRLPPDGARKIIQFTNVEDLVRIPSDEITEISCDEVSALLSVEASAGGCPYCKQPLTSIFFYIRGLQRCPGAETVRGRCQHCYGWVAVADGTLIDI